MALSLVAYQKAKEDRKLDDRVGNLYLNALRAKDFNDRRLNRSLENWRYYLGLDAELGYGQFSPKVIAWMKSQGRDLSTYNICKSYVDQIAGGIMEAPYSPEFYPVEGELTSLTETVKNAAYVDKELCDWGTAYFEIVRAGLVHQAIVKMVIIEKYHPLGNIGLEVLLPNMWWADPMWVSMHTKQLRKCWEDIVLMPDDILELYAEKNPKLEEKITGYKTKCREYGVSTGPTPFVSSGDDNRWGSALHLINEYSMVNQKNKKEYYLSPDGEVEIPKELPDARAKMDWLNQQYGEGNWDPLAIKEKEINERICIKSVICPTISFEDMIDENPTEVQIDQVPFFVWSCDRVNGEPHTIIDVIKSAQNDINASIARRNYRDEIDGGGGPQFVDEAGFETPEECQDYINNGNDPTKRYRVRPGLFADGSGSLPAKPAITTPYSPEAYNRVNHILEILLPHMSKVVPATRGQSEGTGESGYAFNLKKIQADKALYTVHFMLRQFWNQVYEGYLIQAGRQYSIEGIERKFISKGGKFTAIFNEKTTLPDGSIAIKNDASKLLEIRHKVIISEIQDTPTKKMEDISLLNSYLQSMGQFASSLPATSIFILTKIPTLIDSLSEEDRETLTAIGEKELIGALLEVEIKNISLSKQLDQLTNPPPPAPAPAAPGMPVPPQAALPAPGGEQIQPLPQPEPQAQGGVNG